MAATQDPPAPAMARSWVTLIAARLPRDAAGRVRAHRRLRRAGALLVRPGVYALPDAPEARALLAELRREIERGRGSALPGVLDWLDPRVEQALRARHAAQRDERRRRLLAHIERLERALAPSSRARAADRQTAGGRLARLRKQLERLSGGRSTEPPGTWTPDPWTSAEVGDAGAVGREWVTRRGVLVDRIASAWLIRRFVDRSARFRFVGSADRRVRGEIRFDMPEAEFTHRGDHCTFEVLAERFRPEDQALRQVAEVVHDLDLKDGKFRRAESAGIGRLVSGLASLEADDATRLAQGRIVFDCLYASLRAGPSPRLPGGVLP